MAYIDKCKEEIGWLWVNRIAYQKINKLEEL